MVTEVITVVYFSIGLIVFYQGLSFFDKKNKDGDPEGLDALVSLAAALFWPVTILLFLIYKTFRG